MAAAAKMKSNRYHGGGATYGNVAYNLDYAGSAAPALERGGAQVLRPQPKVRIRERAITRPQVAVREAGHVSIFAVVGFAAVGIFAALVLMSYVQLTVSSDHMVTLQSELSALQADHSKLLAQYELAYDLGAIQTQLIADGSMVKPGAGQMFTLDLSEADNVVRYDGTGERAGDTGGLVDDAKGVLNNIVEYFR